MSAILSIKNEANKLFPTGFFGENPQCSCLLRYRCLKFSHITPEEMDQITSAILNRIEPNIDRFYFHLYRSAMAAIMRCVSDRRSNGEIITAGLILSMMNAKSMISELSNHIVSDDSKQLLTNFLEAIPGFTRTGTLPDIFYQRIGYALSPMIRVIGLIFYKGSKNIIEMIQRYEISPSDSARLFKENEVSKYADRDGLVLALANSAGNKPEMMSEHTSIAKRIIMNHDLGL